MEERQAIAIHPRKGEVMHCRNHREAMFTAQSLNEFKRLLLMPDIERARWFIK